MYYNVNVAGCKQKYVLIFFLPGWALSDCLALTSPGWALRKLSCSNLAGLGGAYTGY